MAYLRERESFFKPESTDVRPPAINSVQVGFKRLTANATLPTKAHPQDSGFDLVASEDIIVEPGATVVVPTGIAVQLPPGYEATVRPRSGVTAKTKLRVQLGTIDNGYAGEIGVIVDNISQLQYEIIDNGFEEVELEIAPIYQAGAYTISGELDDSYDMSYVRKVGSYVIRRGDRIAQLVITRLPDVEAVEVFDVEESARGANGFGSSGVTTE